MTRRYLLPESLGRVEVEFVCEAGHRGAWSVVVRGGGPQFDINPSWLTEVDPPSPAEPEPGAYLVGDCIAMRFARYEGYNQWRWDSPNDRDGFDTGGWLDLWSDIGGADVTIRRLVPDPLAEPVELPWEFRVGTNSETRVSSHGTHGVLDKNAAVGAYATTVRLSPEQAREKARALWTAAAQAEAQPEELPDWERELLEKQR